MIAYTSTPLFVVVLVAIGVPAALILLPILTVWSVKVLKHPKYVAMWKRIAAALICCAALAAIGYLLFAVGFALTF